MKLTTDADEMRNYRWRDKSIDECAQDDADELRYQAGERLRFAEDMRQKIKDNEVDRKLKNNKDKLKEAARIANEATSEIQKRLNEIDAELDEILRTYAADLLDEMEDLKQRRSEIRERKISIEQTINLANMDLSGALQGAEARIAESEEQAELMNRFARAIEATLADKETQR